MLKYGVRVVNLFLKKLDWVMFYKMKMFCKFTKTKRKLN
jgi:hypothetical protein